jgi:hypothetical protein
MMTDRSRSHNLKKGTQTGAGSALRLSLSTIVSPIVVSNVAMSFWATVIVTQVLSPIRYSLCECEKLDMNIGRYDPHVL